MTGLRMSKTMRTRNEPTQLALNNIDLLCEDEGLGKKVADALAKIGEDLRRRPSIEKKRTITIILDFVPITNDMDRCDECTLESEVRVKTPADRGGTHVIQVGDKGQLLFFPDIEEPQ